MNVARFEPFSLLSLVNRDLESLAGRRFGRLASGDGNAADWTPAVDITELKDRFVLRADLPGVKSEDIDVRMEDGVLTLSGERHRETDEDVDGLRRIERFAGRFQRRFSLPDTADAENITAKNANGTLEISIPKQPEVQARRITVEAA